MTAISAGGNHTCAILATGGVRCWGENAKGQLGDGTTTQRPSPVDVADLNGGVTAVSAGFWHTCTVTQVGGVKCWGYNFSGQLGDGATATRLTPVDVLMLVFGCAGVTEIPQRECAALLAFFEGAHGLLWQNRAGWLQTPTPCSWQGVTCTAAGREDAGPAAQPLTLCDVPAASCPPRRVGQLILPGNNLHGVLPPELGDLAALQALDLSGNALVGPLPAELGKLTALQTLDLSDNGYILAGPLPAELGHLAALQVLDLSDNSFSGPLPPELGDLAHLEYLDLSHNALNGTTLPPELGRLTALTHLDLSDTNLHGTLPAEFGQLRALQVLNLTDNRLAGPLPAELGQLTALTHLNLSHNPFLSSTLPAAWGQLASLVELDLSWDYSIHGTLPSELGHLAALQSLNLYYNQLGDPIPPELGRLTHLTELNLGLNQLSGPIPAELGRLTSLVYLDLRGNQLSGALPPELGDLAVLQYLNLAGNQLSGPLPPELGRLTALEDLYLSANHLSGAIPPELGNLTGIRARRGPPYIALSPAIPPPDHGYLNLQSNQLSGAVPVELSKLWAAASIELGCNQLSGPFPPAGGESMNQNTFAEYNMLSGSDPHGYWDLSQTLPPANLQALADGPAITLTWTPIAYIGDGGFYEVSYASTPDGPFIVHGQTADKTVSSYTATGLTPGSAYYFRVRTFTPAHVSGACTQRNDLWSDYSAVVSTSAFIRLWLPLVWR